jgi:hypothetical protein
MYYSLEYSPMFAVIHINYNDRWYKSIIVIMCFDYELTELERNLMKPIKQKKIMKQKNWKKDH